MPEAPPKSDMALSQNGARHGHLLNGIHPSRCSGDQQKGMMSFAERIGRRKVISEGKSTWISQKDWEEEQHQAEASNAPQSLFAFCLDDSEKKSRINIMCPALVEVIKKIIPLSFFESTQDSISFQEPYAHLFQYSKDIQNELDSRANTSPEVLEDFNALQYFLASHAGYGDVWKSFDEGSQITVSFDNLWALFRAGDHITTIQDRLEEKRLFRFTRIEDEFKEVGLQQEFRIAVRVHFWYIVWSPGEKRFRQRSQSASILRFAGHRMVTSLPIYPLRYENEDARKSLLLGAQTRGQTWSELVSNPPSCFEHLGHAMSDEEGATTEQRGLTYLQGRVILDQKDSMTLDGILPDIEFGYSLSEVDEKLNDSWNNARPLKLSNPAHFQLCPPQISCYHVATGKRFLVNLNNLHEVSWSGSAINRLILDKDKKDLLKSLVTNMDDLQSKNGDIIANKGCGLTIVLHGPSGVGKTLTAECMAEYAKKPLIPLSVGNLVAVDDSIEDRLTEAFENAGRLGAILLLDEADVVLEARSFEDVRRNGIVSVFLRQLEYYRGILFLTTNRIDSMDPAFQSRIQIAISYSGLTKRQRHDIWLSLLDSNLIDCTEEDKMIIKDQVPEFAEHRLNGRQIRNTLKLSAFTAAADVVSDRRVKLKHVEKALIDAVKFQEYFEEGKKDMRNKNRVWKPFTAAQGRSYA